MNQSTRPTPEPDPERLSIESLERQLRALPPSKVSSELSSKLIATIPSAKVAATTAGITKYWPWIAGVAIICIAVGAALISRQIFWNSKPLSAANENPGTTASSTIGKGPPATSKAIQQYESAVRLDPYNADAWFGLAKAQAAVRRTEDAVSSAQKALDIARSRNRPDLVETVEGWLRSHRVTKPDQPDR